MERIHHRYHVPPHGICMGAKGNSLPLDYQKKLKALKAKETSNYKQKVSEEFEDIIKKKGKNTH
ncbi:unnamed protein product [Nyctereutes procyonoides]|uniref:(raccoon dog) hypothetical protein n=1 Tax=Nyctereutes procyonoides TaxID=34880 RepID=A0A811ZGD5_NYCPR|nr:unnamed protein product [Nyctereutes procyonoides]